MNGAIRLVMLIAALVGAAMLGIAVLEFRHAGAESRTELVLIGCLVAILLAVEVLLISGLVASA